METKLKAKFKEKSFLEDSLYFKLLWLMAVFLRINPYIRLKTTFFFKFVLVYGALILLYDLLKTRTFFENKYFLLVFGFLFFAAISILVNYKTAFEANVRTLILTALGFFILARKDHESSLLDIKREIRIINIFLLVGISFTSLLSLYMFFYEISGCYFLDMLVNAQQYRKLYFFGLAIDNRLTGIFSNPNALGAYSAIALLALLTNLRLFYKDLGWIKRSLYLLALVINGTSLILSDSRGAIISFLAALLLILSLGFWKKFIKDGRKKLGLFKSFGLALLIVLVFQLSMPYVNSGLRSIEGLESRVFTMDYLRLSEGSDGESELSFSFDQNVDKSYDARQVSSNPPSSFRDFSSGRNRLWRAGFNTFKANAFFGVGKYQLAEAVQENSQSEGQLGSLEGGGFHNIYLETLVAYGLMTFTFLMLLLALIYLTNLKKLLFDLGPASESFLLASSIIGFLSFSLINGLVESNMLYGVNIYNFVFLIYLGYMSSFNQLD